jgi:hypothetical protein
MATVIRPGSVATSPELAGVASILFSPGQRWGWQFRDRNQFRQDVSIPRPLGADVPRELIDRAATQKTKSAKAARTLLWMLGLTVVGGPVLAAVLSSSGLAAIAGLYFALMLGLTGLIALPAWIILAVSSSNAKGRLLRATADAAEVERNWSQRQTTATRREQERLDAIAEWGAVRPQPRTMRVDVFGGTVRGRRSLMMTLGSSLLGSSSAVTVLDLTGEATGYELCLLAQNAGYGVAALQLPRDLAHFNLLQGQDPDKAADILVESVFSEGADAYQERILAHKIMKSICTSLRRDLSIVRIVEALRILMGEVEMGRSLTGQETEAVQNLFADGFLKQAHHRLSVLEASLDPLRELGSEAPRKLDSPSELTYVTVTESGPRVVQELLVKMVFGWALHRLEPAMNNGSVPTMVVVGADTIPRSHAERLAALCEGQGVAMIQLFRHLRGAGVEALGSGGAAAFMTLGNPEEAARAAEHIGRRHKFVLAQLTRTVSQNEGLTKTSSSGGTEGKSQTFGFPSLFSAGSTTTTNWGSTEALSKSSGFAEAKAEQRVYELEVEPTELQALPETAVILVQHRPDGASAVAADTNPDIASLPRVSPAPFETPLFASSSGPQPAGLLAPPIA